MKKKSFFFHYNKPKSQQENKTKISLHFNDRCLLVDNVVISVPTKGKVSKRQPKFVMKGKCNKVTIGKDNVAYVT